MKNTKILIVEDDPLLGESLQEALGRKGYTPRLVATGVAALEAVAEESFDILLQDVRLPMQMACRSCRRFWRDSRNAWRW